MYLYHYTSKSNANSITRNQAVGAISEDITWSFKMSQPQKGNTKNKQHPAGFYFTTIAPDGFDGKTKAKTGVGKLDQPYVIVVNIDWAKKSDFNKNGASKSSGGVKITKVGDPEKYCAVRINDKNSDEVPFLPASCAWFGPVEGLPNSMS